MSEEVAAENGTAGISAEDARREKLKQAGAAYFEKVLAQTNRKEGGGSSKEITGNKEPVGAYDDTFENIGAVVEGSKLYVLGTVYVASLAGGMVFTKSSLDALAAPALLAFLHFLPLLCALWIMSTQGALELQPISGTAVQGSLLAAAFTGLQALFLFFSLSRVSVAVMLCWVTIVPHVVKALLDLRLNKAAVQPGRGAAVAAGALATAAALFLDMEQPDLVGYTCLLLWAVTEAASLLWAACVQRPHLLVQLFGEQRGERLQRYVEQEQAVDASTLTFMRHALPVLPILVLGLALGEASELVDHELSVPSMTMILLSIASFGLGVISMLLISEGLAREGKAALGAAGPLGTVVMEAAVHGVPSPLAFAGAVVAVIAGMVLRMGAAAASS